MLTAALPPTHFNYVDVIVVVWLLVGILRGRHRGLTQELLPTLQWVGMVILAGFFYSPLATVIFNNANGAFNHLWSNISAYLSVAFGVHLVILWFKHVIGEKLTGSDLFGRAEYYLGMLAGLIRFACMLIFVCALMNSRVYSAAELAETEQMQKKNFEDIRFPTYGTVQRAVLVESFTGRLIEDNLHPILIASVTGGTPAKTIAQKREEIINSILSAPKDPGAQKK
jgi:uncharacterized membrane protein required for colicin V production